MGQRAASAVVCILGVIGLAGCASPIQVVSANPQVVTIRHGADSRYVADNYAQQYCQQYNKAAHWRTTTSEPTNQQLSIYDCVPL
jgi:hypothetical protein